MVPGGRKNRRLLMHKLQYGVVANQHWKGDYHTENHPAISKESKSYGVEKSSNILVQLYYL